MSNFIHGLLAVILFAVLIYVIVCVATTCWSIVCVSAFGLPMLTKLQMFCLICLIYILFPSGNSIEK